MEQDNRDTYLIFKVTSRESAKIRRLIHSQDWYTGMDIPIKGDQARVPGGLETGGLGKKLEFFFENLKEFIKIMKGKNNG